MINIFDLYIATPAGVRGPPADFLRNQCQKILSRMLRQASQRTKRFLQEMVKTSPLPELIDYFHAFLAFCVDPSSLLSPLSKFRHNNQQKETKRKEKKTLSYIAECFAFDIEMKFKMHKLPTELQVYFLVSNFATF